MPASPIKHIVIIVKENHTFDNYFGTFPGSEGARGLQHAPDPPLTDHPHTHQDWLKRNLNPVKQQYHESDIPHYFSLARQFTLCDHYFTDIAGPSAPNHLMLIAADSPIINNVHAKDHSQPQPPYNIPSLPAQLEHAKLSWKSYGSFAHQYIKNITQSPHNLAAGHFAIDATAGKLPNVSWVYGPKGSSEHPTESVATGEQWTIRQINAIVKGGLWPSTAIFITWDDWGGWYDHVDPEEIEKWTDGTQFRYGSRVGCLVVSPFAKSGYISKNLHSHVSLIKFCEENFQLPSLNKRTKSASDMSDCFDFHQKPLPAPEFSS